MIGDSRPFNECHWIVRMAVINWYYFNIDFQRERQRIFEAKVEDD